jgi:hypothetical protein
MNIGDIVEWYDGEDNRMGFVRDLGHNRDGPGMGIRVSGDPDPCATDNPSGVGWSAWTMEATVKVANAGVQPSLTDSLRDLLEADLFRYLSSYAGIPPIMFNHAWRDGLDHSAQAIYLGTIAQLHPDIRDVIDELRRVEAMQ